MAKKVSQRALDQVRDAIPPDVFEALLDRELRERRDRRREERLEKREREGRLPDRQRKSYREITAGRARFRRPPQSSNDDRRYVPGAVRHWRRMHGLSAKQAGARIGYSPKSSSWRHWEEGFVAPSYRTLLAIIAATGLDPAGGMADAVGGVDPALRLDARRQEHRQMMKRRRAKRVKEQG